MTLTPRTRRLLLGGGLAATLVAVAWTHEQTPEGSTLAVVASVSHKTQAKPGTLAPPPLALEKLHRTDGDADTSENRIRDLFQAQSWYVPPPPPPVAPPPPPAPPPLPFTYMGQLVEAGKLTVFLTRQDQNYVVKAGDTLDNTYRVDRVDAQRMVFTYLPLNMQQTLATGSVN